MPEPIPDRNALKQFRKGVLEIVILKLLEERERYGYELVAELNRHGEALHVKEGTLYPILYRLEDVGYMQTRWENAPRGQPKKFYALTEAGATYYKEAYRQWKELARDITEIMEG